MNRLVKNQCICPPWLAAAICTLLTLVCQVPDTHGRDLIFSTYPFSNPASIFKAFQPLTDHLSQALSQKISIKIAPNYLAHVEALGTGRADLGFAGPSPYVRIKDKYGGVELLARFNYVEDKNDKIVVVCKDSSPLKSLADLRGQTFAFGDHQSFGSHFMPRSILHRNGISLHDLTSYDYVKSHDNVVLSVLHDDFSAGGVRLDVFEKYKDRPLRILAGPYTIPPHVILCRSDLPDPIKNNLRHTLLTLEDRAVLDQIHSQVQGFAQVQDSDFDLARQTMTFIESR